MSNVYNISSLTYLKKQLSFIKDVSRNYSIRHECDSEYFDIYDDIVMTLDEITRKIQNEMDLLFKSKRGDV